MLKFQVWQNLTFFGVSLFLHRAVVRWQVTGEKWKVIYDRWHVTPNTLYLHKIFIFKEENQKKFPQKNMTHNMTSRQYEQYQKEDENSYLVEKLISTFPCYQWPFMGSLTLTLCLLNHWNKPLVVVVWHKTHDTYIFHVLFLVHVYVSCE